MNGYYAPTYLGDNVSGYKMRMTIYNFEDVPDFSRGDTTSFFFLFKKIMSKIFILIETNDKGFDVKPYTSFNRLCKENGIDKKIVSKDKLPFKVGNKTVLDADLNEKP